MDSTSKIPRYHLLKNSLKILDVKDNIALPNITEYRSVIFSCNGTFRINNLSRNESGNYTLQTFDSDGRSTGEQTFQLFIQAPVSSVLLVSECLSLGERWVSCSSERGDSPQYSWTLDGRTLTDAELLSGDDETNNITLKQHVSGRLVCSVKNNVSNVSKEQRIYICAVILLLMVGVLSVLVIFLVVGIAVICFQKKKQNNKSVKQKEEEDNQVERRAVVKVEVAVQHAQVKTKKRSRHSKPTGGDCLYATVHKGDLSDC
ncbi:hepatocyte cell adhesion molecule-like [Oreochromis aureus]|uniref:hepatocyte cell adhesion molecule-like n=1 Tax=Oreochromis aureus TaxID=47969 RepID=UPI001954EE66|nr:hepatocyte cell adhesion molecule-like [Oreochromis aureus]